MYMKRLQVFKWQDLGAFKARALIYIFFLKCPVFWKVLYKGNLHRFPKNGTITSPKKI